MAPHRSRSAAHTAVRIALAVLLIFVACSDDDPAGPGATVASITVDAPASFLGVGETLQLTATPRDDSGAPVSADVAWSTDDAGVATVDASGLVHGVALGDVRVTATSGEHKKGVDLSVRELGSM